MSLLDLLPTSKLGLGGKTPGAFDFNVNSTLDNQSSLNNNPPLSGYQDAYIRKQVPTKQAPQATQLKKYLDNPPK